MDKVLIVDDDVGVLTLMAYAAERAGYDAYEEENPLRALERVRSERVPVVVADLMMPNMDGLTLLAKIKEISPETLVIFVTANATLDSAIYALKEGAFAYLRKPFNPKELVQALKNAFDKVHLLEQNKQLMEDLKAAKAYNEAILRNLTFTVLAVDPEGKIKKVNHAMEKLLGYTEAELIAQPIETVFAREFLEGDWRRLIAEHEVKEFPVIFKRKDGSTVSQLFSGAVMKDSLGKVVGFLGTSHASSS